MQISRRTLLLGAIAASVAPSVALAGLTTQGGLAFGSSWRVTSDASVDPKRVRLLVETIIADVDAQMSPYRAGSILSQFNVARTTDWLTVPAALSAVTREALHVAEVTDGWFDPTVGPTVSRFGFGPITGGWGHYTDITTTVTALRKSTPDLTLDLCGIAKGHALDRIAEALKAAGIRSALIEVGGEVRTLGNHPDGRPWAIGIADPTGPGVWQIVAPADLALATSGPAVNGLAAPVATSHIIDPRRGKPASSALLSVSVLANTAMRSDALATALSAAGPENGINLARRLGHSALFILKGKSRPVQIMTGDFRNHVLT